MNRAAEMFAPRWCGAVTVCAASAVMLAGAGCAAAPHSTASRTTAPSSSAPAQTPHTFVRLLPELTRALAVAREPDGAADVVYGSLRARVRGDAIEWANQPFATAISRVTRAPHGWIFLARDGAVAASDDFLGPLHRVGDFPGFDPDSRPGLAPEATYGIAAVVDRDGVLWQTDGSGPFVAMASFASGRVMSVRFWGQRGSAITDGFVIYETLDGGTHWSPASVPSDRGEDWVHAMIRLIRAGRGHGLGLNFRFGPDDDERARVDRERLAVDQHRLDVDLVRRDGSLVDALVTYPLANGSTRYDDGRDLVTFDAHGHETNRVRDIPLDRENECWLEPWGDVIQETCAEHGRDYTFCCTRRSIDTAGRIAPTEALRQLSDVFGVSLNDAACDHDDTERGTDGSLRVHSLCVMRQGAGRPYGIALPTPLDRVLAIHETTAVVRVAAPDRAERPPAAVALDAAGPATFRWLMPSVHGVVEDASVRRDGAASIVMSDLGDPTHSFLGFGPIDGSLFVVPLPDHVHHVARSDARWLAWGPDVDAVLESANEGRSWRRLPLPIDGVPHGVFAPREWWMPAIRSSRCDHERCIANGRVVVRGSGTPVTEGTMALAVRATPRAPEPTSTHWIAPDALGTYTCSPRGSPIALPRFPIRDVAGTLSQPFARGPNAEMRIALRETPRDDFAGRIAWRGVDAAGAYVAVTRVTELELLERTGTDGDCTNRILEASRSRALVSICGENHWVTPRGLSERLGGGWTQAVEQPPVVFSGGTEGFLEPVLWDEQGTRLGDRRLFFQASRDVPIAYAVAGNAIGIAGWLSSTRGLELTMFPVLPNPFAPGITLPWAPDRRLRPCVRPPQDATELILPPPERLADVDDPMRADGARAVTLQVRVAVSSTNACVSRIDRVTADASLRVDADDTGALVGHELRGDHAVPVRCEQR